jgi:hypothetical protein
MASNDQVLDCCNTVKYLAIAACVLLIVVLVKLFGMLEPSAKVVAAATEGAVKAGIEKAKEGMYPENRSSMRIDLGGDMSHREKLGAYEPPVFWGVPLEDDSYSRIVDNVRVDDDGNRIVAPPAKSQNRMNLEGATGQAPLVPY